MQSKYLGAALAATLLASHPSFASAQTAVTIYGVLDAAISSRDTGGPEGRQTALNSGEQTASRFGLRGTEDLGNGLKVIFNLEGNMGIDTGTTDSALFSRRSVVGLEGDFGSLTLGRDYSPIGIVSLASDVSGQGFYGTNLTAFSANRLTRRLANSVNYKSASWHGLNLLLAYGAGEGVTPATPNAPSGDTRAAGLEFRHDNLYLGAAFHAIRRVAADDDKESAAGAGYTFDSLHKLELKGSWMQTDRVGFDKFRQLSLGGAMPFGPHKVYVNLQRFEQGDAAGNAWGLAYTYTMSKRTNLYATYGGVDNNRLGVFGIASSSNTVAPAATNRGADVSVVSLGMRHMF
ncbi:porin [Massilia sp. TN1-12]|uniref:porin n=1 Tax=Massilia paldalensis TaxID=3377675 RepID=UPI00384E1A1B